MSLEVKDMNTKEKRSVDFAMLPFWAKELDSDSILLTNRFGGWAILSKDAYYSILSGQVSSDVRDLLRKSGLAITKENGEVVVERFRSLNQHLFEDVGLHIMVVTTRCNLGCVYCQANSGDYADMDVETCAHIIKFMFDSHRQYITLEFQGGEPLLNWEVVRFATEKAVEWNNGIKNLKIALVTNGTLLDEEKVDFLKRFDVGVCISYDGPKEVHDFNRKYLDGRGTYDDVIKAMGLVRLKRAKLSVITTITRKSLEHAKKIVDAYVDMGFPVLAFRPMSHINILPEVWEEIGYDEDEFFSVYEEVIRYILELNRKGVRIKERMMDNVVKKVLFGVDPHYVDMCSPCGAGRSVLAYMPNGDIYPCDESRMLKDREMFRLGNVKTDTYDKITGSDNVLNMAISSSLDIVDPNNPYIAWTGTCSVYTYVETGSLIGACSMLRFHNRAIDLFFKFYPKYKKEFKGWQKMR